MTELKTKPNDASVAAFLQGIEHEQRRSDGLQLLAMFEQITGQKAKMWGTSIVGFGQYHYKSERSRQEGDWPLIAFSPRKANLSLYLTTGEQLDEKLFATLGKHKRGKGCLYINKLADVDMHALKKLVEASYKTMVSIHAHKQ